MGGKPGEAMKIELMEFDCSGDDARIVKYRDIKLYKCSSGWPFASVHYYAVHEPSGRTNVRYEEYANKKPDWAIASCIDQVLRHGKEVKRCE